jgi:hypothetical protein
MAPVSPDIPHNKLEEGSSTTSRNVPVCPVTVNILAELLPESTVTPFTVKPVDFILLVSKMFTIGIINKYPFNYYIPFKLTRT